MTEQFLVPVPGSRQDFQFGFTPTMSGQVSIELDVAQPNGRYLDRQCSTAKGNHLAK